MTLNLCPHPSLLHLSLWLVLHTAFKVISTVSPWVPRSYKSEENRPVILVNNAWNQLSLKTKEFVWRQSHACGWGRKQSPLAYSRGTQTRAKTHAWANRRQANKHCFNFLILGCLTWSLSLTQPSQQLLWMKLLHKCVQRCVLRVCLLLRTIRA